jgi:hypothetical protein
LISAGTRFFLLFVPGANLLSNCDASSQRLWRSRGIVRHEKFWRVFFRDSIQAAVRGGMIERRSIGLDRNFRRRQTEVRRRAVAFAGVVQL